MLAIILLWVVVYLSGILICKIEGEREASQLWIHLTGFFFLIFLQGVIFLVVQLLDWNFSKGRDLLAACFFVTSLVSLIFCHKEVRNNIDRIKNNQIEKKRHLSLLLWLFLALLWIIISQRTVAGADAIVETTAITLHTDTLNKYHPFTHQPLYSGIIFSRKLITLPFLYSAISSWTGIDPETTVRVLGTSFSLLFSFIAFAYLGKLLFHDNKNHTYLLLIMMEFLYLSGDYDSSMDIYRQLYQGYSGEVIVALVLLPAVITILYRLTGFLLREDFHRKEQGIETGTAMISLSLCFAASIFLTTITWGVFMLLLSLFLYGITAGIILWMKREKRHPEEVG